MSWIPLFGQISDSLTCYDNKTLKAIANKIIYANECDTLLKLSIVEINLLNNVNNNLQDIICTKDEIINHNDSIIINYKEIDVINNKQINELNRDLDKMTIKRNVNRFGFATSGTLLGILLLILLI